MLKRAGQARRALCRPGKVFVNWIKLKVQWLCFHRAQKIGISELAQVRVRVSGKTVTFARCGLQPGSVDDMYRTTAIIDQACLAEVTQGSGDTLAAHRQHLSDEVVSYAKVVGRGALVG